MMVIVPARSLRPSLVQLHTFRQMATKRIGTIERRVKRDRLAAAIRAWHTVTVASVVQERMEVKLWQVCAASIP